jgi:O-antigen ligase
MKFHRIDCLLIAAAGCLPFCNPHRFPPIAGFWGQWAAAVLFAAWMLWRWWSRSRDDQDAMPLPWPALAFFSLAALGMAQAVLGMPLFRTGALVPVFELLLAGFVCAEAARVRRPDEQNGLLECFAWGVLIALLLNAISIVCAHLDLQVASPFNQLLAYAYGGREVGLVGQSNHLGMLAVLAWMGGAFLHARGRLPTAALLLITAIASLVCASSSSRTALGVFIALTALYFVFAPDRADAEAAEAPRRGRSMFLASVLVFAAIQVGWQFIPQAWIGPETSVIRSSISGRQEMLRDALLVGWRHPLLGAGFGRYPGDRLFELSTSLPYPNADNAHNLFGQMWAEWGMPGVAIVIATIVLVLLALRRNWRSGARRWEVLLPTCWVAALLLHSQVEYPLWFAHFLYPFAWMLGLMPSAGATARLAGPRLGRGAVVAVGGLLALLFVGAGIDYRRSESLATRVLDQVQHDPRGVAKIPKAEAMRIAEFTLFPVSAELMQARALDIDPLFADAKLKMAMTSLKALPHPETMSRYLAFLVMDGRQQQADEFLQMIRRRSPTVATETEKMLRGLAPSNQFIAAFLAATASEPLSNAAPGQAH